MEKTGMPLNNKELIWFTGFWEGDGSCGFYPKKGTNISRRTGEKKIYWYKTFRISACQKYRPIIAWLYEKLKFGCIVRQGGNQKYGDKVFEWRGEGLKACKLLKRMQKYMRIPHKKLQARGAINGYEKWNAAKV